MIRAEQLSFSIGDFQLRRLSLEVAQGQYFVLLGPAGSGKTIFLECLCGLRRIESGQIYIDGHNVTMLEPRARSIGYVPQDYALFPHLSVEKNIAFGLRSSGRHREEISAKVARTTEMLGIEHLLERSVLGLSGGEKQRASLARALVLEPKVLLLDEPVCALDEGTRQNICALLHSIQRKLGLTVIHVSHNLEEAFTVADRAAVLNRGVLQQVGSLNELLRKPKNEFVARFMRCENIFYGEVTDPGTEHKLARVKVGSVQLQIPGPHNGKIKIMIRPEDILVIPLSKHNKKCENEFPVKLARWRDYGGYVKVELRGPFNLLAHLTGAEFAELQAERHHDLIAVSRPENIHVLSG